MAMVGGSMVGAVVGLLGIMLRRARALSLSILLVAAFIFLSLRSYYAIFFTPLFTGGILLLFREHPEWWKKIGAAFIIALFILHPFPLGLKPSLAREVMQALTKAGVHGEILINGSFGHEWQYESALPIRKYRLELLSFADALICLRPCEGIGTGWRRFMRTSVEVWSRF
ncbi:hypothetical protein HYT95_01775, partial [Candidatus Peregrinibacteria bacterium]|nr:hypothetical protein [Candidatus Peregrinibacteria bacterium]